MSLGILKLFRLFLLVFSVLFITSCSYKYSDYFNTKDKIDKKVTNKKIIAKERITKQEIKIQTKKKIIKKAIVVKKESIKKQKIITKPKAIKKSITKVSKPILIKKKKIVKKIVINNKNIRTSSTLTTKNLDEFKFDFIKKGKQDDNTFLVIGGIQGDEPGGFMAASLIATHYKITKGSVWVVPNLNFYSIIKRSRGPYGDMNRKFAKLSKNDPEYEIIQRIKSYITAPDVSLILNLHDGSGFYRPMYIDHNHQPEKWGQCSVIDQEILPNVKKYNDTYTISEQVVNHINKHLLKKEDFYRTKNTHTRFIKTHEEQEMAKSLTYYAVKNGKSAFGHETSKSLSVAQRVYYKLLAIEKYMDIMGIKYKREFKLNVRDVKRVLNEDVSITFNDSKVTIPLNNIRNIQKYFPINKDGKVQYLPSNPLIKIIKKNNLYTIFYGNRRLTKLEADYTEHLSFDKKINFNIDGKNKKIKFGSTIKVRNYFLINKTNEFRVNVIGYKNKSGNETQVKIRKNKFIKRYSIERKGKLYRVEFYKGNKFAGMILVNYIK